MCACVSTHYHSPCHFVCNFVSTRDVKHNTEIKQWRISIFVQLSLQRFVQFHPTKLQLFVEIAKTKVVRLENKRADQLETSQDIDLFQCLLNVNGNIELIFTVKTKHPFFKAIISDT